MSPLEILEQDETMIVHFNSESSENLKRNSNVWNFDKIRVKFVDKIPENFHETRSLHCLSVSLVVRDLHVVKTIFDIT